MSLDDADRWEREQFRLEHEAEDGQRRWQEQMDALEASVRESKARRAREAKEPRQPVRGMARPVRLREVTVEEAEAELAQDAYEMSGGKWAGIFAQRPHEDLRFSDRRGA